MNQTWQIVALLACMGVMTILFWTVFVIIVRYLISVYSLIRKIKTAEPELWNALGRPTIFPMFHTSFNPFQGLLSQARFCRWFLNGGKGAMLPESKEMVLKTKRLYRISMYGFVSLFIVFFVFFAILMCVIGMKATTSPNSEPAAQSIQR